MTQQRKTFELEIKRTNTTNEPNKGVYVPVLTSERVVIQFQCDAGTFPFLNKMVQVQDDKLKEQNQL